MVCDAFLGHDRSLRSCHAPKPFNFKLLTVCKTGLRDFLQGPSIKV